MTSHSRRASRLGIAVLVLLAVPAVGYLIVYVALWIRGM